MAYDTRPELRAQAAMAERYEVGVRTLPSGNAEPPAPPSLTDDLAEALSRLSEIIGVTSADADNIRERLFGGWPENSTAGGAKAAYPGVAGVLLDTVQIITDRAVRLNETVQVLNARI